MMKPGCNFLGWVFQLQCLPSLQQNHMYIPWFFLEIKAINTGWCDFPPGPDDNLLEQIRCFSFRLRSRTELDCCPGIGERFEFFGLDERPIQVEYDQLDYYTSQNRQGSRMMYYPRSAFMAKLAAPMRAEFSLRIRYMGISRKCSKNLPFREKA
jgi:hypothetical protein